MYIFVENAPGSITFADASLRSSTLKFTSRLATRKIGGIVYDTLRTTTAVNKAHKVNTPGCDGVCNAIDEIQSVRIETSASTLSSVELLELFEVAVLAARDAIVNKGLLKNFLPTIASTFATTSV